MNKGRFNIVLLLANLLMLLFLNPGQSVAQQDPMFTQYMNNILAVNPAYAGSKKLVSAQAMTRNQWVAFEGAPVTQTFSLHAPITKYQMGLGISILKDEIGPISQTAAYIDYSYSIEFNQGTSLSFGLKGGVNFYNANVGILLTSDPNDPIFINDVNRKFLPNFGIGMYYYSQRFMAGLSVPKLLQNTINDHDFSTEFLSKEQIHYFFMTGYVVDVNRILKFKPYALIKYVKNAPVSLDLSAQLMFYNKLWIGARYSFGDAMGLLTQLQVTDQLRVGYSYDIGINDLGAYNNGTHEILIGWDFNFGRGKIRSPRYF